MANGACRRTLVTLKMSNNFHYIYLISIIANIILSTKDFMYGKQALFVMPLEEEKYLINTSLLVMRHFQILIRCLVHIQVGDWANGKILLTFGYLILDIRQKEQLVCMLTMRFEISGRKHRFAYERWSIVIIVCMK
jgi:hypothetical protein